MCDGAVLMAHRCLQERGLLVDTPGPEGVPLAIHAPPYRINGQRPPIRRAAPTLGQDNAHWLGPQDDTPDPV